MMEGAQRYQPTKPKPPPRPVDLMMEDPLVPLPYEMPMSVSPMRPKPPATRVKSVESIYTTCNGEKHIYAEIPSPLPPNPPPPRNESSVQRSDTWHGQRRVSPPLVHAGMPKITETDEDASTSTLKIHVPRKVQSLKRPPLLRQGSRGDVLVSKVIANYKGKVGAPLCNHAGYMMGCIYIMSLSWIHACDHYIYGCM